MKKIIVAGAGHGGLTAAYNLAQQGFDVTVYEKGERDGLGYDWHDCLDYTAFDNSGVPRPPAELIRQRVPSGFENPSSTVKLYIPFDTEGFMMDRKELLAYLIGSAEEVGVKFVFGAEITGALLDRLSICGIRYKKDGEILEEKADMVIDSCGMNSPVKKSLPPCFNIKNKFEQRETFYVYRAYYENLTGELTDPPYLIGLFHNNKPGIDWVLSDEKCVDILVGKFGNAGELTDEEIEESVNAYRQQYPFIGEKIVRGGQKGVIPLCKMLPLLVADGYAIIGDNAGMTIPLNGSGIVLSMCAGKILADKICDAEEAPFSKENLWKYQHEYFLTLGKGLVIIDILKNFFTNCKGKDVDYFLEKKILTEEHLNFHKGISITPGHIMYVASVSLPLIRLLSPLVSNLKSIPSIDSIAEEMPEEYSKEAVEQWIEKYKKL